MVLIVGLMLITYLYINSQKELFNTQKKLIFYELYTLSSKFLEEILKEYNLNKEKTLKANNFIVTHEKENINNLKNKLGKNYHIFITDKNLTVRKTTFKYDQNFSLAFAKDIFVKHKNHPGISPPICEPATTEFFTFSDRYINGKVIQVGYILKSKTTEEFKTKIKTLIKQNPYIKDITLFFIHPKTKYAQECKILTPLHRKYTLQEMIYTRKEGFILYKSLLQQNPIFEQNAMYILATDPFNKESYIIFKVTVNNKLIAAKIYRITILAVFTVLTIAVFSFFILIYINKILNYLDEFTFHIKNQTVYDQKTYPELDEVIETYNKTINELRKALKSKDDFIHFAMHELATPINILALYTEDYPELKPAIIKLISSYKNMSYYLHKNPKKFQTLNLKHLIQNRLNYFKEIIKEEQKKPIFHLEDYKICANKEDIEIFIDNNIKNAIKYSTEDKIEITLQNGMLTFTNAGVITDTEKIFNKFYREEKIKGGFGLGLYIIHNIAKQYKINIKVTNKNNLVTFKYDLKDVNENCDS
jgi:signal transduction histidine kinase